MHLLHWDPSVGTRRDVQVVVSGAAPALLGLATLPTDVPFDSLPKLLLYHADANALRPFPCSFPCSFSVLFCLAQKPSPAAGVDLTDPIEKSKAAAAARAEVQLCLPASTF